MLPKRRLSLAGIAVGALALTVSTSVPLAYGHGWTNSPISRAKLCQQGAVQNCGAIQWEPQSVEGPKGFPAAGPADGVLCSAGLAQFHELDDQRGGAWPATQLQGGQGFTFTWHLTAPHSTADFSYYMTKQGWKSGMGPGRQSLGSHIFWHFENPCGGEVELFTDMDRFDDSWQPKVWESQTPGPAWMFGESPTFTGQGAPGASGPQKAPWTG